MRNLRRGYTLWLMPECSFKQSENILLRFLEILKMICAVSVSMIVPYQNLSHYSLPQLLFKSMVHFRARFFLLPIPSVQFLINYSCSR